MAKPLAIRLTAVNVSDGPLLATMLNAEPRSKTPSGQRCVRPQ